MPPHSTHVEYAVISYGETAYKTPEAYENIYKAAAASLEPLGYTKAGEPYAFSNQLLRAAMFQNTVYPLYCHGNMSCTTRPANAGIRSTRGIRALSGLI